MVKKIVAIPATISSVTAKPVSMSQKKRKVAAYARVSTDRDEQQTSYEAQVDYYTNYIKSREDWEFAGVYTDEGITGTSTKHREGFKQMVKDALAGKIELILAKSLSRFSRNTVDSLTTIRKLKAAGVECYFEKENIRTFDSKGELLITIMSSLAQEESRSISENCKWGQRKRFADGKVSVPYAHFLGYDKGENGVMVVNEEEAAVVRRIFALYLSGLTPHSIAKQMMKEGAKAPGGQARWHAGTIDNMLSNEKYMGDALLQKRFTEDFLTKKQVKNNGEVPQYYVENDHEAIISKGTFEAVQFEKERRRNLNYRYSGVNIYASKIICGECGGFYGAKVWHSNDKYRKLVYRCNRKYGKEHEPCSSATFSEDEVKEMFVKAVNSLLKSKTEAIENLRRLLAELADVSELELKRDVSLQELQRFSEQLQKAISANANQAKSQTEYRKQYDAMAEAYEKAKNDYEEASKEIQNRQAHFESMKLFLDEMAKARPVTEFDESLWGSLLEKIIANDRDDVVFHFKDGTQVKVGV